MTIVIINFVLVAVYVSVLQKNTVRTQKVVDETIVWKLDTTYRPIRL